MSAVEPLEEGGGQFRARPVVHDPAMLQGDGSGAEGQRVVDLMQGHEHGEPVLLVQIAQRFHNVAGRFRIERGNGLVRQQDAGALHKGAGNGGALLLPSGEVGGALMRLFHDADAGQRLVGKPGVLFMEEAQQAAPQRRARQRAEHDVAQNGHAIHQIELLEDHADFRPHGSDVAADHAPVLDEVLRDLDPPAVGVAGHEPRDMAHQGRFSGTGRADERDHFAGLDVQADPVKPLPA